MTQASTLPRLPHEMWTNIFEYTRPSELIPSCMTSRLWNTVLISNNLFGTLLAGVLYLALPYLNRSELMTLRLVSRKLSARVNKLLENFMKAVPECSHELFQSWLVWRFVPRTNLSFQISGEKVTTNDDVVTPQEHPLPSTKDYLLQVEKLLNENWESVVVGRSLEVNVVVMPGVNMDTVKYDPALQFFRKFGKRVWNLSLMIRMGEPPQLRRQFLPYLKCTPELRSVDLLPQLRVPLEANSEPDYVILRVQLDTMLYGFDLPVPLEQMLYLDRVVVTARIYYRGNSQLCINGDQYFANIFHRQFKHISYLYMYDSETISRELDTCSNLAEVDICLDYGRGWVYLGYSRIRKLTIRSIKNSNFLKLPAYNLVMYVHWAKNTLTQLHLDCDSPYISNIIHSDLFDVTGHGAVIDLPHLITLVVRNLLFTTITGMTQLIALKTYRVLFSDELLPPPSEILGTVESGTDIWSVVPSLELFIYKERRGTRYTMLNRSEELAGDS